ncbi:lytic polysaccharide monooxygenase [Jackrogersella minutella]|nr:lytic polysaccharide monooxygenase [Jackrogersella minutella]
MQFTKISSMAGLVALVNGHMIMKSPAPFDPSALTNAPLDASGSDFPCKFGAGYTATGGTTNSYALGSKQTLSFVGQATHGGGSCQVSITYDTTPTKDSVWKVIHSIEGGCPAKGVSGNMGDSADAADPFTYPYTIPSDIPAGKATIAWTWMNKVGNREFYMNCGALELTGTGGDKSNFDKLPDMLVLNIDGKPSTLESYDYIYENPGDSVEDNTSGSQVATCGTNGCTPGGSAGSGSGSGSGASSAYASAPAATSAAAPASSAAASGGAAGGVFITQSPSSAAAAPTSTAAADPTSAAAADPTSAAAAPTATSSAGTGSSSGSSLTGACSPEGTFNCLGSTYQQCASGQWSVVMQMAAGTTCSAGQSTTLNIAAVGKRLARFFRA